MLTNSYKGGSYYLYLIFILSPLLALILAIISFRERVSRQIIFLFLILFGLTMGFFGDSVGESMRFAAWYSNNLEDLLYYFKGLYVSGSNVDFIQQIIMYLVSRVTNDPSIYFGVVAAIFAFFYLRSFEKIYDQHSVAGNQNALIHFWFFSMLLPVSYISGSRWALAAWIFFFAVYSFLMQGKKRFISLAMVSILVHFSFFGPVMIFLGFVALGRRNVLYYLLIGSSFILQPFASTYLNEIDTSTFVGVQERVSIYNNVDEVLFRQEVYQDAVWFIAYPKEILWFYLCLGIYYARKRLRFVSNEILLEKFYSLCLFLFAFANLLSKIPSGGRFKTVFLMFATLYLIILFARAQLKGLSELTLIGLVPMLVYFVVEVRRCFDLLNITLAGPLPLGFLTNITLFGSQ